MAKEDLLKALTGSTTPGSYPDTLIDRLDAALTEAWTESSGLNIPVPTSGSDPGPFAANGSVDTDILDQATSRFGVSPKARTLTEKAALLEALVKGIYGNSAPVVTPPAGGGTTTPPPSTTLPPGTSQGTLSWAADYSKNDVVSAGFKSTNWNTESGPSWPPPIGTYAGRRAIKFALGGGGKRIEVEPNHKTLAKGDSAWSGFQFYLESGFPISTNSWQVIFQWHGNDTTSPQQCIQLHKGQLSIADNHLIGPQLKTGQWYQMVNYFTADSRGSVSVWLDGVNICDNYGAGLNATPLYLKCGLYHDTSIAGGTIYQTAHTMGTGYGACLPKA